MTHRNNLTNISSFFEEFPKLDFGRTSEWIIRGYNK